MADGDRVETHTTESTEMEHVRYAAPYTSPSRGSPPRKAPYTDVDATSISMRTLNKTPQVAVPPTAFLFWSFVRRTPKYETRAGPLSSGGCCPGSALMAGVNGQKVPRSPL